MAPEVILCETIKDTPYDYKADIWSLGKPTCSNIFRFLVRYTWFSWRFWMSSLLTCILSYR